MSKQKEIAIPGKERYAIYTGRSLPGFTPVLAGITFPDPSYEICRPFADCYVFEYVLSGKGCVIQNDERVTVEEGDAYILKTGEFHHYFADAKEPWKKIWFNVNGSLVRHLLSDYGLYSVLKVPAFGNAGYLPDIFRAIEKKPVNCANEVSVLLHRHIQALSSYVGSQEVSHSQALSMKNFIEQNLTQPLNIENMVAHVHLSRSRALHLFKETYGITPYNYYLSQKMELAQTMLKCTALSVGEISEKLGFSDYHHFSGSFKKRNGISPSQYRSCNGVQAQKLQKV